MKNEKHVWQAGPFKVVTTHNSRSCYGISVYTPDGARLYHERFGWGPSKHDAISMAVYKKDSSYCDSVMSYLFRRIDSYIDGPGFLDAWFNGARYEGVAA